MSDQPDRSQTTRKHPLTSAEFSRLSPVEKVEAVRQVQDGERDAVFFDKPRPQFDEYRKLFPEPLPTIKRNKP